MSRRRFDYDYPKTRHDPRLTWYNRPTLFGKCTARRRADGSILNVGDGSDRSFSEHETHQSSVDERGHVASPASAIWRVELCGARGSVYGR